MHAWVLKLLVVSSIAALRITPMQEPDIFFDHVGTLHNFRGIWETKFHTRMYPTIDLQIILQLKDNLNHVLNTMNGTDSNIYRLRAALNEERNYAIKLVQENTRSRAKRSGGVFGILKDFLFGGNEVDEQLALLRSTEDKKIANLSDKMDEKNKLNKRTMHEISYNIVQIREGISKIKNDFSESKKNILSKFVEETILMSIILVQNIINSVAHNTKSHGDRDPKPGIFGQ